MRQSQALACAISGAMLAFIARLPITLASASRSSFCTPTDPTCTHRIVPQAASVRMSTTTNTARPTTAQNVLGGPLELCCTSPKTGFYRDGFCHTGPTDHGVHTVCAVVTDEFLEYSRAQGNDLITPAPQYGFPGLKQGDKWCLCVSRWREALDAGKAPGVVLEATHEAALRVVSIEELRAHAVSLNE